MRSYRKVKDHYEFRLDGGRLALLGVGVALVLVLVFLLGVLVGKALWGQRRLPVAAPVQEPVVPAPAPPLAEPQVPPRPTYSFYEELKKPDPPTTSEPRERAGPPPETPASAEPQPEEASRPPSRPEAAKEPSTETPTPAPSNPPPARAPAPVFTVQVGSFRDRDAAVQLADQVGVHGVQAQVVKAAVAGRTWYRVQVGRFDTRSEAESHYRRQLKPRGVQGFVTTR